VLRHDAESLRSLLEELQHHTETIREADWRTGGGLFLRYLDMCRNKSDTSDRELLAEATELSRDIADASAKRPLTK
jgi:hypothetical protein